MLEHGSHIVSEPGFIFTFNCLCRAYFIYWYVYIYLSSIAKMRPWYSQEGLLQSHVDRRSHTA
jgi:hypothetical protein